MTDINYCNANNVCVLITFCDIFSRFLRKFKLHKRENNADDGKVK